MSGEVSVIVVVCVLPASWFIDSSQYLHIIASTGACLSLCLSVSMLLDLPVSRLKKG
jgi:hypothetical protein